MVFFALFKTKCKKVKTILSLQAAQKQAMGSLWPTVVCWSVIERSAFRRMGWTGQETERGDREARKEPLKTACRSPNGDGSGGERDELEIGSGQMWT